MNNPTIVSAALDDKALRESIDKLVQHVEQGTQRMAKSMDASVEQMKRKLAELGNTKIDFGGTADGGATRRTRSQQAETQAVRETTQARKELKMTLDQQAQALQTAMQPKSARDSFYAFFQGFREQAQHLEQLIRSWESLALNRKIGEFESFDAQIDSAKQKINDLKNEITQLRKDQPEGYRGNIKERETQIESLKQKIIELQKEQQKVANTPIEEPSYLTRLRAEHERVLGVLRDETTTNNNIVGAQQQQTNELDKQLQKIKEINSSKSAKAAYESVSSLPTDTIDQANAKLQALQALKEKVANTPLLSKTSQSQITQAITDTKVKIEQLETSVRGTNQSKKSLDELNASVRQSVAEEQKRRDAILQTGVAAQETFAKIRQSTQIQLAENTDKPIMGIKELTSAIQDMERAYWGMESYNRESPLGQSLKRDIENAQKLRVAIDAFNKSMSGMPVVHGSNDADKTLGSYTELSNILKTLTDEYRRLGAEERNAAKGNDMADKIQRLGRETQKIQQQMNRPINLDAALKGSEKTLDDIAYKMQRLSSFRSGLNVDTQKAEINTVNQEYDRLKKKMDDVMQKNSSMIASNNALGRSWNYMKNRLAFYFTVGASTQFIKNLIEVRSQYEMNEKALGILINSAERGTQIFNELSQMALVSPYTLIELSSAAKQLVAYDVAAKDVVDTTRRLADMASAVGVPMERLTYALGQIKAYGYLNSRDARMFANAGIPLVKQLADYYTELEGKIVSTADVYDRIKKKSIEYGDVMQVITKMTDEGGKFFDFQAKMAETLKVQLANLTLAWNNMLNDLGSQSQGVLNTAIGSLKTLFLHWKQISSVIENIIVAFGLYKLAMIPILAYTQKVGVGLAAMEVAGKRLTNVAYSIGGAFKSLAANWKMMVGMLAAYVAYDMYSTWDRNREAIRNFNDAVAKGAEESAKSIEELLKTEAMAEAKLSALQGKLSPSDAEKTWEALREEIEKSSIASSSLIPILLDITNINDRVSEAFTMAEDLRDVESVLSGLKNELKMNQDTILGGLFGEGLAEDLKDYTSQLEYVDERTEHILKKDQGFWEGLGNGIRKVGNDISEAMGSSITEAENETKKFAKDAADTVAELLGKEGVDNATKLAEAVARVKKEAITATGARGYGRTLLELSLDREFADRFANYDRSTTITQQFLDQLKKDYGSAFGKITTDILDKNEKWNATQISAFKNTYEKLKKQIPDDWAEILDEMVKDLNSRDWTVKVMAKFDVTDIGDIQKAFNDKFINATDPKLLEFQQRIYGKLMRKDGEDNVKYEERITKLKDEQQKIIKTNAAIIAKSGKTETAVSKEATKAKQDAEQTLLAIQQVKSWGGYDFTSKTDTKARKQAESELQKALKEELQLIEKVRSAYKDLTKEGASRSVAIEKATTGFDESVAAINKTLAKFGVAKLDLKDFAGISNPRELVKKLQEQLDRLLKSGAAKPAEIQALQVEIQKITLDAEKYDLTMITKGLNNELDKLKEEYELAVELDANPELGDLFVDWMGLDKDKLNEIPRSFTQVVAEMQRRINKIFDKNNIAESFDLSKNLNKNDFDKWIKESGRELDNALVKELNSYREFASKILNDEIKDLGTLVSKYGDAQAKIEKIYRQNLNRFVDIINAYGGEADSATAVDLSNQISISDDPKEVARLKDELKKLVEKVANENANAQTVLNAVLRNQNESIGKALWDDFKSGDFYSVIFDDLSRASTDALQTMKAQLDELKDKVKESPESMKALMSAYAKLRTELIERDPFKAMVVSMQDYQRAEHDVVVAQTELDDANKKARNAENTLNTIRKNEPKNIKEIASAEKNVAKAKNDVAKAQTKLIQAQNGEVAASEDYKKAVKAANTAINKLGSSIKAVGDELDNSAGRAISFIGDILTFATTISDAIVSTSTTASGALQAIESASVILTIISTAIKLMQALESIMPDAFSQYEKAAEKQAEINKLTDAVVQYQLAVLAARLEEENWFSGNSLKQLKNYYQIGSKALDAYNKKLIESQAAYQNETGGGWLTTFAYWTNPATWIGKILGVSDGWADAISLLGSGMFGMEAQMGQLGIWLTQHAGDDLHEYEKGFTAAINNLRIETREASKGFLGSGIGGHSQETEDLISWVRKNLKDEYGNAMELFDEDFMLNQEAYQVLMDKYADRLVGETKATLEALNELTDKWNEYIEQLHDYVDSLYSPLIGNMTDALWDWYDSGKNALDSFREYAGKTFRDIVTDMMQSILLSSFGDKYAEDIKDLYDTYVKGGVDEKGLIRQVAARTGEMMESFEETVPVLQEIMNTANGVLGEYGISLKESAESSLSALQQGIQSVSETTASALEAYMNGVSQQVYLQSDLLTQIRDSVAGFSSDVQVATMGQILLQLQLSYQTQNAIQSILEGWSTPSGLAVRVEMN